jgi:hypothetical protein
MAKTNIPHLIKKKSKRYIPYDSNGTYKKTYLVLFCNTKTNFITREGPYFDESRAFNKMRELLLDGYCAWVEVYNE